MSKKMQDDTRQTLADGLARDRLLGELYQHRFLPQGWNGPKSFPPSLTTIVELMGFVRRLPLNIPIPSVSVLDDGTLNLYWDLPHLWVTMGADRQGESLSVYVQNLDDRAWVLTIPLATVTMDDLQHPLQLLSHAANQ